MSAAEAKQTKTNKSAKYYDDIVKQYIIDNWDRMVWRACPLGEWLGVPQKIMKQELPQIPRNRFREIVCRKYCEGYSHRYDQDEFKQVFGYITKDYPKKLKRSKPILTYQLKPWFNEVFREKYCPDATFYPATYQREGDDKLI
jgi:hypothetical protein